MSNSFPIYGHLDLCRYAEDNFYSLQKIIAEQNIDKLKIFYFDDAYVPIHYKDILRIIEENNLKADWYFNKDYPLFYFYIVLNWYFSSSLKWKKIDRDGDIKHFSYLPGATKGRPSKWAITDELAKRDLLKKGIYSWADTSCNTDSDPEPYNFKYFKNELKLLDYDFPYSRESKYTGGFPFPQTHLKNCLFNIVIEEAKDNVFISEKTASTFYNYKSLLYFCSGSGGIQTLLNLGFDLCQDIIDYNYDSVDDKELKVKLFVDEVEKLCNIDPKKLYDLTEKSRKHNINNYLQLMKVEPEYKTVIANWSKLFGIPFILSW